MLDHNNSAKVVRFLIKTLCSALGASIAMLIIFGLCYGFNGLMELFGATRMRVRVPVGLMFLPILGLLFGWKMSDVVYPVALRYWTKSRQFRLVILMSIFWIVSVISVISLFEPEPFYSGLRSIKHGKIELFFKILLFPPLLLALGTYFYFLAILKKR